MGERNIIKLVNDGIYLYSHWKIKEELQKDLKNALIRGKDRWDDRVYLNRIIFSEMIKNSIEKTTGYGLGTDMCDGEVCFEVDVENKKVNDIDFDEFIKL